MLLRLQSLSVLGVVVAAAGSVLAAGVPVGGSSLIGTLDYSDTFTTTGPVGSLVSTNNRRPEGFSGSNAFGSYNVEDTHGNPSSVWQGSVFTFAGPSTTVGHGGAAGNSGAATGFAQAGTGDTSFTYGALRDSFVVQFDAIMPDAPGRLDLNLFASATNGISSPGSMSIFFRRGDTIDLYRPGVGNAPTGATTALASADRDWHNFAAWFDGPTNSLSLYIDQVLLTTLDLTTFSGGQFLTYSRQAIGFGSENLNGGQLTKVDNFQVGAYIPAPGAAAVAFFGLAALGRRRRSSC